VVEKVPDFEYTIGLLRFARIAVNLERVKVTHHLTARLLRNRASFYKELLARIPWEELRTELDRALADSLGVVPPETGAATPLPAVSSALLRGLMLDEWLKKDGVGVPKAKRVISLENALGEALQLEQLGILICDALSEEYADLAGDLEGTRDSHVHAFLALSELRDRLDYHRLSLVEGSTQNENSDLQ
jgi:hypothetical protein